MVAEAAPNTQRRAVPPRWSLALVLGVPVLVLTVLALGYLQLIHYTRIAHRHIPREADSALRIDLQQVVLFEPFRKHILPAVAGAADASGHTRLHKLDSDIGINSALDVREIVIAHGPGEEDWTTIIGGLFPSGQMLAGIERVLRDQSRLQLQKSRDGKALFIDPWGLVLGQAGSGCIIVSTREALLRQALQAHDDPTFTPLANAAGGFVLGTGTPLLQQLLESWGVGPVSGGFTLQDNLLVEVHTRLLRPDMAAPEALEQAQRWSHDGGGESWAALRALLARVRLSTRENELIFHSYWERAELDAVAEQWGARLSQRLP